MFIWTSKVKTPFGAATVFAASLLLLMGCETGPVVTSGHGAAELARLAPSKVEVTDPGLVIAGPKGYCVDPSASRNGEHAAFVLLGSCAAIAGTDRAPEPKTRAVLTATVNDNSDGYSVAQTLPVLDRYFRSEDGRKTLSRDRRAETVQVLDTQRQGKAFFVHAKDVSQSLAPELSDDSWRAFFDVEGKLVSATVAGTKQQPITESESLRMLKSFVQRINRENRS
ncbi:MAG: hypothetical protein ABJO27_23825 [Pseudoruegeria sp.]